MLHNSKNLILLIFKFYVCKSRGSSTLSFSAFLQTSKNSKPRKASSLKKSKKTWRFWKEMVIYRKYFAVWIRMQIIQNNKKTPLQ